MKFATLADGTRDGVLVLVSRDLDHSVEVAPIARTLQDALDHWSGVEGRLRELATRLEAGQCQDAFPFVGCKALAPMPRAYAFLDGSAYLNHVELVRRARGAQMPQSLYSDPLMYQGSSSSFLAPCAPIAHASEDQGIDFESEVCVIVDDVPQGTKESDAGKHIRLLVLMNDVTLRNLVPDELAKGFGFLVSKPPSALSPVAVTPDELGAAWRDGKVHLPLVTTYNGEKFGDPDGAAEMHFSFNKLIEHAAQTRPLGAGTIIGSGTVSTKDRARGSSCLAEMRMIEKIEQGAAKTPFMKFGDNVRIEMVLDGKSVFGAIDQKVVRYAG